MCHLAVVFRGVIKFYSKIMENVICVCVFVFVCVCVRAWRGRHGVGSERANGGVTARIQPRGCARCFLYFFSVFSFFWLDLLLCVLLLFFSFEAACLWHIRRPS